MQSVTKTGRGLSLKRSSRTKQHTVLHHSDAKKQLPSKVVCAQCGQDRDHGCFNQKELLRLQAAGLLVDAQCYDCNPRELSKLEGKLIKCNLCKEEKRREDYTIGAQQQIAKSMPKNARCRDCCMPACTVCGQRPQEPLNSKLAMTDATDKLKYRCENCTYPACSVCATVMTRNQRKWWQRRIKQDPSVQEWTCTDCQDKSLRQG